MLSKENFVLCGQVSYWHVMLEVMCMQQINLLIHIFPIGYGMVLSGYFLFCSFQEKSFGLVASSGNNSFRECWQISIDPRQL